MIVHDELLQFSFKEHQLRVNAELSL